MNKYTVEETIKMFHESKFLKFTEFLDYLERVENEKAEQRLV